MNTRTRIDSSWIRLIVIGLLSVLFLGVLGVSAQSSDPGSVVCEVKLGEDDEVPDVPPSRVAESLHLETYSDDPDLLAKWNDLFGADPETSPDDIVTLQSDYTLTWEAGELELGGEMKAKIKDDSKNPGQKKIKIEKAGKNEGTTEYVSGTGGLNANLADGGWHGVKVKEIDGATMTFDVDGTSYTVTGRLKTLHVELDDDSTVGFPIVKKFKAEIIAPTTAPDVAKGTVTTAVVEAPESVVVAAGGVQYDEKVKEKPEVVNGHVEAEAEFEYQGTLADVSTLTGDNAELKERKGACEVSAAEVDACPGDCPCWAVELLDNITAVNQLVGASCDTNPIGNFIIQNDEFTLPDGGFGVDEVGDNDPPECFTRQPAPDPQETLQITEEQRQICECEIRLRCEEIGSPIP